MSRAQGELGTAGVAQSRLSPLGAPRLSSQPLSSLPPERLAMAKPVSSWTSVYSGLSAELTSNQLFREILGRVLDEIPPPPRRDCRLAGRLSISEQQQWKPLSHTPHTSMSSPPEDMLVCGVCGRSFAPPPSV